MTFERTRSGQENRSAFLGVDYVCYVEGGGGNSDYSDDVIFWKSVLSLYRPELKIHFLARGGKPELEARARDIVQKDIAHSLVAMDNDFDELLGDQIDDKRVLYTYGYSWENDVLAKSALEEVYTHLVRASAPPNPDIAILNEHFEVLETKMKWPIRADYYALSAKSSVLPRDAPGRLFRTCDTTSMPLPRSEEIIKLCANCNVKTKQRELPELPNLMDSMRYCAGKVYAHLMRLLICAVHKLCGRNVRMTPAHLKDVALLKFPDVLRGSISHAMSVHYSRISEAV